VRGRSEAEAAGLEECGSSASGSRRTARGARRPRMAAGGVPAWPGGAARVVASG